MMKIWRIASGILSIIFDIIFTLQFYPTGIENIGLGVFGFTVSLLMLIGAIASIYYRNGGDKGNTVIFVIYGLGSIVGFMIHGSYENLAKFACWCTICAGAGVIGLINEV